MRAFALVWLSTLLVVALLCVPLSAAANENLAASPITTTTNDDPRFANGYITIYVVEWPAISSGPVHESLTRNLSQAVLTISGRPLFDKIWRWTSEATARHLHGWGKEDRISAYFVIDFMLPGGALQKKYISNGCVLEDEAGKIYPVAPGLKDFLAGLTASGVAPVDCKTVIFEEVEKPEESTGHSGAKPGTPVDSES